MVGSYLAPGRREEKEGKPVFAGDFRICFITWLERVSLTFIRKIELMAVIGGQFSVIENSLIGCRQAEYLPEYQSSFSGGKSQ